MGEVKILELMQKIYNVVDFYSLPEFSRIWMYALRALIRNIDFIDYISDHLQTGRNNRFNWSYYFRKLFYCSCFRRLSCQVVVPLILYKRQYKN